MAYGNAVQQNLYYKGPYFLKNRIASVYGWFQKRERYGSFYHEHLKFLMESQWYSNDELERFQFEKVKEFLIHAKKHCVFYRELFREYQFDPEKLQALTDLTWLPILEKETVRNRINQITSDNVREYRPRWTRTSGTTGTGLQFPLSSGCFQREYAFRSLHYLWGNIRRGDKLAFCTGHPVAYHDRQRPPFWVYDSSNNWLILSSYHLSDSNLPYYIGELDNLQPDLIAGYPSSVYLLAVANERFGGRVRPRAIYTTAETLYDFQRAKIEESFGCKVLMWYGNSEMCANIVECEKGRNHLKLEHSYVEILNGANERVGDGEEGRLVCTGIGNYSFPLVRYNVGDVAVLSKEEKCQCGRGGTLVERIVGRTEDYVVTADGRLVGRLDHLFKDSVRVKLAQIIQNEVEEIVIRIVKDANYNKKDEEDILREAQVRVGSRMRVRFEYVDEIERTANGKYRFIVSNIREKSALGHSIRNAL